MAPWHGSLWVQATDSLVSLVSASPLLSACQACRSLAAADACKLLGEIPQQNGANARADEWSEHGNASCDDRHSALNTTRGGTLSVVIAFRSIEAVTRLRGDLYFRTVNRIYFQESETTG